MANYIVSDTNLTAVANAIRQKGGTSASLEFPDDFVEAIGDIQTGGGSGTDYLAARLKNTLTSYSSSDVTAVPTYAFYECSNLQSVSLQNTTRIGDSAFYYCTGLTSITAPEVTFIGSSAFYGCSSLTSAPLAEVTSISTSNSCFYGCSSLTSVSLPKYYSTFALPQSCFRNCTSLTNVELPSDFSGTLNTYCFGGCTGLEELDVKNSQTIQANCFNGCTNLKTLILRRTSVASLSNVSAFDGTPFASGGSGGTLYVPNDLISSYQSANRWSTILGYANNQIKKIEGSIYE